jgi:hypothetical protein
MLVITRWPAGDSFCSAPVDLLGEITEYLVNAKIQLNQKTH